MMAITDIVKKLIIVNIAVYVLATVFAAYIPSLGLHKPFTQWFEPYQLVTHMFMHADPGHLMFNMLGLFFLGPTVEMTLGPKRFLVLYLLSGFAATAAHFALASNPVVGASGAIYGVIFAFIMLFPDRMLNLIIPPVAIKAKYLGLLFIAVDLLGQWRGGDNVAHFAHLGGALAGFILIQIWRKTNLRL